MMSCVLVACLPQWLAGRNALVLAGQNVPRGRTVRLDLEQRDLWSRPFAALHALT